MELTMYGTKMCSKCKVAKAMLNNEFKDSLVVNKVDVDDDQDKIDELINLGFSSFPVLFYNGNYYDGSVSSVKSLIETIREDMD